MRLTSLFKPLYSLLLVFNFLIIGGVSSQTCSSCTTVYDTDTYSDIYVDYETTVCILNDVTIYGTVYMNGGILCNSGNVSNIFLSNGYGTIENHGIIYNNETLVGLTNNLTVNSYPGALFEFRDNIDFDASVELTFRQYNGATVLFSQDLNFIKGSFIIENGTAITVDELPVTSTAYFNANNISFDITNLSVFNSITGELNLGGSMNIANADATSLVNEGIVNIYNSLNISGNADKSMVFENKNIFLIGADLYIDQYNESFTFTNQEPNDEFFGTTEIYRLVYLGTAGSIILNNGIFTTPECNILYGTVTNNRSMNVTFVSNSNGYITNNGHLKIESSFDNYYNVILGSKSYITTENYTNIGTITGPSTLDDDTDPVNYPRIDISGTSNNSGQLNEYLLFYDKTLVPSPYNIGYGFDVVSNTWNIAEKVKFLSTVREGLIQEPNCLMLSRLMNLTINSSSQTYCPGYAAIMTANTSMEFLGVNGAPPYTSPLAATYVWQPGALTGSIVSVNPEVTTIYTVTATYQGCSVTQTVQVNVIDLGLPTISYSNTTVVFPSVNTFTVNRSHGTGGNYAITKLGGGTCSGVSINSSGLITVSNNLCYGTYVVHLCMTVPGSGCENPCVTTVVQITDGSCPIIATQPTLALCPDEKTQLNITSSQNSFTWAPSTGLSCINCKTPLLAMDDSGTRTYTVSSKNAAGAICGSATITVNVKTDCQQDDIIGCCFSNYGAAVEVEKNTFLNIYCNLINELGSTSTIVTPATLEKGEFRNQVGGTVRVLLDWIHNAKNTLYIPAIVTPTTNPLVYVAHAGTTAVFGGDQKIRGNSSTDFNELRLEGSGTKSVMVNEFGYSILNLNDVVMHLQNSTYAMKNTTTTVNRTTGYVSNNKNGYFSWLMSNGTVLSQKYFYPMGSRATFTDPFRFRPIMMANNSTTSQDEVSVNFMNIPPAFSTDPAFVSAGAATPSLVNLQAPNVLQINHQFYHKFKKTIPIPAPSDLNIKYFYTPSDGTYQSIAEWEQDANQVNSWWGSTPGPSGIFTIPADPLVPGMKAAVANGTFNFNHKPFTLSRAGFYVNTNSFGDFGTGVNNPGTSINLSATPLGGGTAPTGGGLGNAFGTGANSGNTGGGGNTTFTPNPVSGNYVMTISPANSCAIPGRIKFVIDINGNIQASSVEYGDSTTSSNYLGGLSEGLYTIDNINQGITFSATPTELMRKCVNITSVKTSTNDDFILDLTTYPTEKLKITLPPGSYSLSYLNFMLYNTKSGLNYLLSTALLPGTNNYTISPTPPAGVYRFEFTMSGGSPAVSETIKGQIIIK